MPLGTWGTITRTKVTEGRFVARTNVRDLDGHRRRVEAWGRSGAEAERRLKAALAERVAGTARIIGPATRLTNVADAWLDELAAEARVLPQTIDTYRSVWVGHLEPALGQWQVREASVSRVDAVIRAIAAPGQVAHARTVLSGVLGLAVRHDALPANPVRSISRTPRRRRGVATVDLGLLEAVRRAARMYRTERDEHGRLPPGPRPTPDLGDIIDLLLATGARPGEVLALRWSDVDLSGPTAQLTISGTLVQPKGHPLTRQPFPKTHSSYRTLKVPRFAADTLLRRQVTARLGNPLDAVFPSRVGTWLPPRKIANTWRNARAAYNLPDITFRQFRPTVATLIAREAGAEVAKAQLGHSTVAVTESYYIAKAAVAPDSTAILDALGPTPGAAARHRS